MATSSLALTSPALSPAATSALADAQSAARSAKAATSSKAEKAQKVGEDFESVFMNSMFGQMFEGVGKGPFSGGHGASVWRSFLTDEFSKSFVKSGGIGLAPQVARELMAQQEVK